jgi:NADPH2:quinone reductase
MRALICRAWGSIEDLTVEDVAPPAPAADEVLVDVRASSVNYADSLMVAGKYQTRPPLPFSPGLETAGVVARCGSGVTRFRPGDRVMATLAWGGLAEQAVAKESETFGIPPGMSFEEAGAFPIAYISSDVAIRWQGRLEAGETLLVLGAAGGVGLTAVEIGKAMGARVIAGASTAEKLAVAREHGADEGINYARENLTERVMALTGDRGADVCFDPVGGDLADAALSSLGWGGRLLVIGFVGGVQQIPANRLLVKNRSALPRTGQAPCVGGGPPRLVRDGPAPSPREPPAAPRAERGGDPPAHRPQGSRQGRGHARELKRWRSASRPTARTSPSSPSTTSRGSTRCRA